MDKKLRQIKELKKMFEVEEKFEYDKWDEEIPFIPFKKNWVVAPRPNFGGAIVRFKVKEKGMDDYVSVYLDCYDVLGHFGEPYWEIYPYEDDVYRIPMKNVKELVKRLDEAIKKLKKEK